MGAGAGICVPSEAAQGTIVITGKFALASTTLANPAKAWNRYNSTRPLQFAFESCTGSSTDALKLYYSGTPSDSPFILSGDMSDYYGSIVFPNGSAGSLRGVSFPGTLRLEHKVAIDTAATAVEVGTLFASNCYASASDVRSAAITLEVQRSLFSTLKVANALTVTGDAGHVVKPAANVKFNDYILPTAVLTASTTASRNLTLIDIPASCGAVSDSFTVNKGSYPSWAYSDATKQAAWNILMYTCFWGEETSGDRQLFKFKIPRFTYTTENGTQSAPIFTNLANFKGLTSSDTIQGDTAYVLAKDSTTYPFPDQADYVFPGGSVVFRDSCYPTFLGNVEATNLVFMGYNSIQAAGSRSSFVIKGNATFLKIMNNGSPYDWSLIYPVTDSSKNFELRADLHGDAQIRVTSPSWAKATRYMSLTGDNSDFKGSIYVFGYPSDSKYTTLSVNGGAAFGGARASYSAKAVRIGGNGILNVTDDAVLSEPTRGIYFENLSKVSVAAGKTFTAGSTATFTGSVTKAGSGTLRLSGTVAKDGENRAALAVTAGKLMPAKTDSLANLAVTFASGAALAIDGDSDDAEYVALGIDLATASMAFSGTKKVLVGCADLAHSRKVAIASGAAASVASFAENLVVRFGDGSRERKCTVSVEDNGTGKTLYATYNPGCAIFFR